LGGGGERRKETSVPEGVSALSKKRGEIQIRATGCLGGAGEKDYLKSLMGGNRPHEKIVSVCGLAGKGVPVIQEGGKEGRIQACVKGRRGPSGGGAGLCLPGKKGKRTEEGTSI